MKPDELVTFDVALHESEHALLTALMGGHVRTAMANRPGKVITHSHGHTKFDPGLGRDREAAIGFAGPWTDARWHTASGLHSVS